MTSTPSHQTSIQLLELAQRLGGIGHWHFHVTSGKVTWSAETYRIHGLNPEDTEPGYEQLLKLYSPESATLLASLVERAVSTGVGYDIEATIRRPDGSLRYVSAKAECVLDADGKVEALFGVFHDITERTQAERFMRALTNYIPAMVAYWDSGMRCRYANLQYLDWFGRTPAEMIGISIEDLMGAELFARNAPFIRGAMSGQPQTFERTLIKPSGETGYTLARYIPDVDETGRVLGMVALVTDITTLKQAEIKLQQATDAAREALAQSEAALQVKKEFLSNVSHELRNPLTGIAGFSELLSQQEGLSVNASKYVVRIRDACGDLLTTVNDLLDFSKLESGEIAIITRPVDPYTVGLDALEFFEPQLRAKNLSHAFVASDLPGLVTIDPMRVRQILLNLIGNAVKVTDSGAVDLRAEYKRLENVLRYTVTDTGPGIPTEQRSKLFQRFSQVDASAARRRGGVGLGLAICRGLADAMGGRVAFTSEPGKGSRFWVDVPCATAEIMALHETRNPEAQEDLGALQGMRLLVVDDHAANRELVKRMVETLGIEVVEAFEGAEAVERASRDRFDIILMDLLMPELDGSSAAQLIRSRTGPSQRTPIVAFTAAGDAASQTDLGPFSDRLLKPFAALDLLRMLARHAPGQ